jgi:hypothetical protein
MNVRGTPDAVRLLVLPAGLLAVAAGGAAAIAGGLAPGRWLGLAVLVAGIAGAYELVRAVRVLVRQRRAADDWLRTATGEFVAPSYAWRARQLTSPRERRTLARTLRLLVREAFERPVGWRRPLALPAVRAHRDEVLFLAQRLERVDEPVSPAGMLRVVDLVTDGGSPLWTSVKDDALGDAIATTLALLRPAARAPRAAGC